MKRRVFVSAMVVFALTVGCTTARGASPAPSPAPAGNEEAKPDLTVLGGQAEIWIDSEANAEFDTVTIKKGTTDVSWYGKEGVRNLLIAFKKCGNQVSPPKRPPDPTCYGDECTLEKGKHKFRQGTFCYAIVVVRDDGTVKSTDPRLIINP